jgi:hypothetical protein
MKWVTRRDLHVDRTACAWLIRRHIDPEAEFVFVAPTTDPASVAGHTFDMRDAEYTHVGDKCTFEVLLERHGLNSDKALCEMGQIIREADVPPRRGRAKESRGLDGIMRGFQIGISDDYEKLRLTAPVYDALYAYCKETSQAKAVTRGQGTPRPRLRYSQRVVAHLQEQSGDSKEQ